MKTEPTLILAIAVLLFSCNKNECSPENVQKLASEAITANLNEGVNPMYRWTESELLGDVYLIKGAVTLNGSDGARIDREAFARVWCNGSDASEVTMIDVEGLIRMKYSNEAGRDTALTSSQRTYDSEMAKIKASMDSLAAASEKAVQDSQHFLDSLNKK